MLPDEFKYVWFHIPTGKSGEVTLTEGDTKVISGQPHTINNRLSFLNLVNEYNRVSTIGPRH